MIALALGAVKRLLTPFVLPLAVIAAVLVTLAGAALYDRLIDDPAVVRAARVEYVLKTENEALLARLDIERRARIGAEEAAADYAEQLQLVEAIRASENERIAQEIADYETQLETVGRACRLDHADVEWLRKP